MNVKNGSVRAHAEVNGRLYKQLIQKMFSVYAPRTPKFYRALEPAAGLHERSASKFACSYAEKLFPTGLHQR